MSRTAEERGLAMLPEKVREGVSGLPVLEILDDVEGALDRQGKALVQAPPGAGKTTVIPLALLCGAEKSWLKDQTILVLEPRRLAARACAARMAELLGETLGETVGYQVRMDRCVGPGTRIEVITEGILTRRLQNDPELSGVGLVIFDEFHERHLHSDLGLALALEAASVFRPDLRLLVMSATMDMDRLQPLLDNAPVVTSQGRSWPVATHYLPPDSAFQGTSRDKGFQILPAAQQAVQQALAADEGDILVFLPGAAQIRALAEMLAPLSEADPCLAIHTLFGALGPKEQAAAIAPSRPGCRKIVLATNIAETSLTIEGVRVVVDTGLARVPKFSSGTGMTRLETLAVSRASADQRRGRAGRTGPGVCYRLWSPHVHQGLIPFNRPEILGADLTQLVLELALWGTSDPNELKWLDLPPKKSVAEAKELLLLLGALDEAGRITPHGKALAAAGIHPRLARMVLGGKALGQGFTACCLAALAEAGDFVRGGKGPGEGTGEGPDPDIRLRLEMLARHLAAGKAGKNGKMGQILVHARGLAQRFAISRAKAGQRIDPEWAGRLLGLAWPERIARQRSAGSLSYLTAAGSGCVFRSANSLSNQEFILALDLGGHAKNPVIFLAAPYDPIDLEEDYPDLIRSETATVWDTATRSVRSRRLVRFESLVLADAPEQITDPEAALAAMISGIRTEGLKVLPWTKPLAQFCHRVNFLRENVSADPRFTDLPDLGEAHLAETLENWLAPFLSGITSVSALKKLDLDGAIKAQLSWEQMNLVEAQAPSHIRVPSGSKIPLAYADDQGLLAAPVLAVRLQEMFGLTATPAVAGGKVPVTLHLLSPAGRPVQITRDLESFWASAYAEVKKDLAGRYPKHYWPEDPLAAVPTNRAKPRKG